jgi:hypothetical protein
MGPATGNEDWRQQRRCWAEEVLNDELHIESMRAIVRAHLATNEEASRDGLAREIGISPKRLRLFLAGSDIGERAFSPLNEWTRGRPTPPVAPETVALNVLARFAPATKANRARAMLARSVREVYRTLEVKPPPRVLEALDVL